MKHEPDSEAPAGTVRIIFHGGAYDGQEFDRLRHEATPCLELATPDREITQTELDQARRSGALVEFTETTYVYKRLPGVTPTAAATIHYCLTSTHPTS